MYPKSAYNRIVELLNDRIDDYEAFYDDSCQSVLLRGQNGRVSEYGFGPGDEDDIKRLSVTELVDYAFLTG